MPFVPSLLKCHQAIKLGIPAGTGNRNPEFKDGYGQKLKFEKYSLEIKVIAETEAVGSERERAEDSSAEMPLFQGPERVRNRANAGEGTIRVVGGGLEGPCNGNQVF